MSESLISADSDVIEVPDLWEKGLPSPLNERASRVYCECGAALRFKVAHVR